MSQEHIKNKAIDSNYIFMTRLTLHLRFCAVIMILNLSVSSSSVSLVYKHSESNHHYLIYLFLVNLYTPSLVLC